MAYSIELISGFVVEVAQKAFVEVVYSHSVEKRKKKALEQQIEARITEWTETACREIQQTAIDERRKLAALGLSGPKSNDGGSPCPRPAYPTQMDEIAQLDAKIDFRRRSSLTEHETRPPCDERDEPIGPLGHACQEIIDLERRISARRNAVAGN